MEVDVGLEEAGVEAMVACLEVVAEAILGAAKGAVAVQRPARGECWEVEVAN